MGEKTKIQWCDSTAAPWEGCTHASPGCDHCAAERRDRRHMIEDVSHWGKGAPRREVKGFEALARRLNKKPWVCDECEQAYETRCQHPHPETGETCGATDLSFHRARVFPFSMDWLDPEVEIERLANFLRVVHEMQNIDWLLLTKRPELWLRRTAAAQGCSDDESYHRWIELWHDGMPPANVWLGVSIEDQKRADERREAFKRIPAALKFVSYEPALEGVDWRGWEFINWIILGGESGPGARLCNIEWLRSGLAFFRPRGTRCFVKQLGSDAVSKPRYAARHVSGRMFLRDPKGGNPAEWPEDLRVREWPKPKTI